MPKVLISDSLSNLAKEVFENNNIEVDVKTELSPANLQEIINNYSQDVPNGYGLSHGPFLQKIINNLINGNSKPPVTAKDGILTTKIIHSLYASCEKNSWISIKDGIKSEKLGL